MTLRPSVAVTDVTFAFEIDVIAPALTKCEIVVQYKTFLIHWLYRRGVLEFWSRCSCYAALRSTLLGDAYRTRFGALVLRQRT